MPQEGLGCQNRMEEEEEAGKGCWRRRLGGAVSVPGQSRSRTLARICWRGGIARLGVGGPRP